MNTKTVRLSAIAFIALFISGVFLMNYLQSILQGTTLTLGVDIYPRWVGSQLALQGQSPYSLETRHAIWNAIYGSANTPTGNPFGFYYPPSIITLFAPFIMLGISLKQAVILACAALWALWGTFVLLWVIKTEEKSFIVIALLLLSGLFYRLAYSNYLLGQSALFCLVMTWAAWVFIRRDWYILAGICLALALVKPSASLLPVFVLLIINYRVKKLYLSFIIANLLLFLLPTILLGRWITDFLTDLARYSLENETAWNASHILTIPGIFNLLTCVFLLIWGWIRKDMLLLLASAFAINSLFVPHTADYDLIIFTLLIFWIYEQKEYIPIGRTPLVLALLWTPWVSLLMFNWIHPAHVEDWYPLIWNSYPSLLLFVAMIICSKQINESQLNTIRQV